MVLMVLLLMLLVVVMLMLRAGGGSGGRNGLEDGRRVAGAERRRHRDGDGRQLEAAVRPARHDRRGHVLVVGLDVHRRLVSASGRSQVTRTGGHQIDSHSFHASIKLFFSLSEQKHSIVIVYNGSMPINRLCFALLTLVGKK